MPHPRFTLIMTLFFVFFITSCNNTPPPAAEVYSRISPTTLNAGDPIPMPSDKAILTVSGKIGAANQGNEIVMDIPTLEALGMFEYKVNDPFKHEAITYQGPQMNDLLALWQVDKSATKIILTALNDYKVEVNLDVFRQTPTLFALKANGSYMPVADRGPSMLVFPYNSYELDHNIYDSYWIWQIKSIEVQ